VNACCKAHSRETDCKRLAKRPACGAGHCSASVRVQKPCPSRTKRPAPDSTPTRIAPSTLADGSGTGGTGSGATKYPREEETEVVSEIVVAFKGEVGIVEAGYATLWTLASLNGIGHGLDGDGQVFGAHFTITG
jgi:hypothetical protein